MTALSFTPITADIDDPPSTTSPANFAARGDVFLGAFPDLKTDLNLLITELNKLTSGLDQTEPIAAYSAATTYNYPDVCAGSDGHTYRCISTSVLADDPTASVTGDWLLLSFRPASSAATITGTDDESAVTPAGLQAKVASTSAKGIIEIATDAEVATGTDTEKAICPASLQAKVASTSAKGIIGIATDAEIETGEDDEKAITSAGLEANRANLNKVYVLSTRSTPGTWNISVLEPGVPVYLATSSTITFSVTSGTAEAGATSFTIGTGGPPGIVLVPSTNLITLNVTAAGGTTRAYHAYQWTP